MVKKNSTANGPTFCYFVSNLNLFCKVLKFKLLHELLIGIIQSSNAKADFIFFIIFVSMIDVSFT